MDPRTFMPNRPTNPLLQLVYLVAGGVLLIGAVLMGAVVLAFVFGLVLIFAVVFWLRLWWLRRRFVRGGGGTLGRQTAESSQRTGEVIEVEYTVVDERDPPSGRN
jgi:small-conductance mechanosensitive channel